MKRKDIYNKIQNSYINSLYNIPATSIIVNNKTMIGTLMLTLFIFLTGIFTSAHAQQLTSNTLGIKITSPIKGQKVPVGSLTISGTSTHNTTTSNCPVSVIVNNVKPYQNATAIGPGGNNDYSKWNFKLTSHYTMIKEGLNKITAKFLCNGNPDFLSYYSVNVTGIGASPVASTTPSSNASAQKNTGAASTKDNNNPPVQNKSNPINFGKSAIGKNNEPFVFPIPSTNSTIKPLPSQSGASISGSSNNNEGHHHKNKKSTSDSLFGGDPFFK